MSSGAQIALSDIFNDANAAVPTLASQADAVLKASLGSDLTWNGSAPSLSFFDKAWAMTQKGLEFTWSQGELASQAAGMPSASLAWSNVKPLIKLEGPAGQFLH